MSRRPKIYPFKEYKEIEPLLADFRNYIVEPQEDRREMLYHSASQIFLFLGDLMYEPSIVAQIVEIIQLLRTSRGAGVIIAEKTLMETFNILALFCVNALAPDPSDERRATGEYETDCRAVLDLLVAFARDCFSVKRPHDSFGGQRRAAAFELLTIADEILDMPDVLELAHQIIKTKKSGSGVTTRRARSGTSEAEAASTTQPNCVAATATGSPRSGAEPSGK